MKRLFPPRRELGRTGFKATLLGIGDVADRNVPFADCVATVRRAMDAGLNVIDTAPGYEDGYSEEIVAGALQGRRESMFVIDKIDRLHEPVAPQVESSLKRLCLEASDLFVFHGVSTVNDWERIAGPGGGLEQLEACIRAGKARFQGISSHHPDVLRRAVASGRCHVVLFAAGPFSDRRYVEEILPLARARGVGTVCFKSFGAGKLLGDTSGYNRPLEKRPRGLPGPGGVGTG
ncbi:MAG: aldo/keto reductase, partial [Planctomycetota bacterium]